MTRDKLLAELRALEVKLRSPQVQLFFQAKDQETRARFVSLLNVISVTVNRLSNDQLVGIADQLTALDGDLKAGIANVKDAIKDLNDAIAVLNTISSILGIVGRVVGLVI